MTENCKRNIKLPFILLFILGTLFSCTSNREKKYIVDNQINLQAEPFSLSEVRLLDGPFKHAMEVEAEYLLSLEPDRLLHNFHLNAGLPVKGEIYGGWESRGVAGHSLGHYLSACSMMFASSGDEQFKQRVEYVVEELKKCQDARETGYVGGIPDEDKIFSEVSRGDIRSQGFDLNGGWVPWYTQHKIWAGLIDAYVYCDNELAKTIVIKLSDWACENFLNLPEDKFQQMLACEHGGMNESLAEVYALTGEIKYLDLSTRFHHNAILDPLAAEKDELAGKHANTQIPKIIGCSRLYELTGDLQDSTIASFFWETITNHHSYVTGGNSEREHLGLPDELNNHLSTETTETCNTYNMLKLTKHLFSQKPLVKYADYYERALYNHILSSQNPDDGMVCYMVPLSSGSIKKYGTPFESFWCCTGTGMENHVKYGEAIYFKENNQNLMVNLYIPSVLNWEEKGFVIRQESKYPEESTIQFTIDKAPGAEMELKFRLPWWAKKGMSVAINGETYESLNSENRYIVVNKVWENGDQIMLDIPMTLTMESMPDNESRVAFLYGPLVLSGKLGEKNIDPILDIPVLITNERPVDQWMVKSQETPLLFQTLNVGQPHDIELIPFYRMHHEKHMVYFDLYTDGEWKLKEKEYLEELARKELIRKNTIDLMAIGEMQPERDHNFSGDQTSTGEAFGRKWRDARNGGWFAIEMKVTDQFPLELICTYWGNDGGNREFDIMVDDKKLATQTLNRNKPDSFFDVRYSIPAEYVKGKSKVKITFQAHPEKTAGGLFGCRLIKK
ncbi:beta-L-arabinofuranosidase domain-containing protein [Sunxiuqinia sp. A32]|uniref:beta-L-arabinofuranosidase domain-containing protein n=1 Tax=Sunxiuqinia sp. A32 TaxID=3461496 RepID=UPI004045CD4B